MDNSPSAPENNTGGVAVPAAALPPVPETWPGAFGAYKHSRDAVKRNLMTLIVLWLITIIVSGLTEWLKLGIAGQLISFIISSLLTVSLTYVYLAGVRGQQLPIGEAITKSWPLLLKMIGLIILVSLLLMGSLLLLIIPFFFVLPRVMLAEYFLVDKNMAIIDALKASWEASKGHAGKIWGIIGASIVMVLPALTIIGIPVAIYLILMYSAAYAVFYEYLHKSPTAAASPAAPTPNTPAV